MPNQHAAFIRHAAYYESVLSLARNAYQSQDGQLEGISLFDRNYQNIDIGRRWACSHAINDVDAAALCSEFAEIAPVIVDLRLSPNEQICWISDAIRASQKLGDRLAEGRHYGNLGNAYSEKGELQTAKDCYEKHLEISISTGDEFGESNALGNLGNIEYGKGNAKEAIPLYERALQLQQKNADRTGEAASLVNLGAAHSQLNQNVIAERHYQKALKIFQHLGDWRNASHCLGNLGLLKVSSGELVEALSLYEERLRIARELKDAKSEARAELGLARVNAKLGYMDKVEENCRRAIVLADLAGDLRTQALAMHQLGDLNEREGLIDKAIVWYEQSSQAIWKTEDKFLYGRLHDTLGVCYVRLGRFQEAEKSFLTAMTCAMQTDDTEGIERSKLHISELISASHACAFETEDDPISE